MIEINDRLEIPESELEFTASRSTGPGGQHVNKVSSRVTLHFDVASSPSLTETQRQRIFLRLPTRINKDGVLQMHAQKHRSQLANRREIMIRFADLLRGALEQRRPRKKTRPSRAADRRRLDGKKRRADLKQARSKRISHDD